MFIIGVRGIRKVEQSGSFHCPACGHGAPFERSVIRGWFTLFFIPCIPLFTREGEQVLCKGCGRVFKPDVPNYGATPGQLPPALPQEELQQLRPSVHPKTGLPVPPPLPKQQLAGSTVISYQSNAMATASLVLGVLGVVTSFLFVPGYFFGLLALILGFVALRRVKRGGGQVGGKGRARTGIACSLVALLISAFLTIVVVTNKRTPTDVAATRMNDAVEKLTHQPNPPRGNNSEARKLASSYASTLASLIALNPASATDGTRANHPVHCELRNGNCAFIVHVPEYPGLEKAARDSLNEVAWVAARTVTTDRPGSPLCVALRDDQKFGIIMTGKMGGTVAERTGTEETLVVPFFTAIKPPPLRH